MTIRTQCCDLFGVAMQKKFTQPELFSIFTEIGVPEDAHFSDGQFLVNELKSGEMKASFEAKYACEKTGENGSVLIDTVASKRRPDDKLYTNVKNVECKISLNGQLKKINRYKV